MLAYQGTSAISTRPDAAEGPLTTIFPLEWYGVSAAFVCPMRELAAWTGAMLNSGKTLNFDSIAKPKVD